MKNPEAYEFNGYDIPIDLMMLTGGGPATFDAISSSHMRNLKQHANLGVGQSVLELGCGIGRDAIPLVGILGPDGKYLGVDIIGRSIDWCASNITARNHNFRFVHFDVRDQIHNPNGKQLTQEFSLPVEEASIDLVFAQSVFTHLFPPDISHYLREFRRILKPGGLVYATVFIYDEGILESARRTNLTPYNLRFEYELVDGVRLNDPVYPTGAVAFTEAFLFKLVAEAGLELARTPLKGAWSGYFDQADDGQDVLILRT